MEYVMPKMMSSVTHITETGHAFGFMCVILYYGSISIVLERRVGTSCTTSMLGETHNCSEVSFLISILLFYAELNVLLTQNVSFFKKKNLSKKAARNAM